MKKFEEIEASYFNGQHKQFRKQLKKLSCNDRYEFYLYIENQCDNNIYNDILRAIARTCIARQF